MANLHNLDDKQAGAASTPLYDPAVIDPILLSPKALCPNGSRAERSQLARRNYRKAGTRTQRLHPGGFVQIGSYRNQDSHLTT
jgi:hypothetical protein